MAMVLFRYNKAPTCQTHIAYVMCEYNCDTLQWRCMDECNVTDFKNIGDIDAVFKFPVKCSGFESRHFKMLMSFLENWLALNMEFWCTSSVQTVTESLEFISVADLLQSNKFR